MVSTSTTRKKVSQRERPVKKTQKAPAKRPAAKARQGKALKVAAGVAVAAAGVAAAVAGLSRKRSAQAAEPQRPANDHRVMKLRLQIQRREAELRKLQLRAQQHGGGKLEQDAKLAAGRIDKLQDELGKYRHKLGILTGQMK